MKLTLIVEYRKEYSTAQVVIVAKDLAEKAAEYGEVLSAKLTEVPTEIDVS